MATAGVVPSQSFLAAFLPIARSSILAKSPLRTHITARSSVWRRIEAFITPAALVPIPSILGGIWDGLLRAVPKKKTSHMKKRHRQMAGKALKDVTALNKCSACGRLKRAHIMCPYCVQSIQKWIGSNWESLRQAAEKKADTSDELVTSTQAEPSIKADETVQKTT